MTYNAAIVGLGQIGQGYDYCCKDGSLITTHASAYQYHPSFNLVAGVDVSPKGCAKFEKKYNVETFSSVQNMMEKVKPDVVSIASPTPTHFNLFNQIASYDPLAVLIEKPIALRVREAETMLLDAQKKDMGLVVNYVRRFEPGTNALRKMIADGTVGDIYKGSVLYCKGLINNGSHFIDLLIYLLGSVRHIQMIQPGRDFDALGYNDGEPDFLIRFNDTDIIFQATRSEYFSMGEVNLIGTKGTIYYGNGQIRYKQTIPDPADNHYTLLQNKLTSIKTYFESYQYYVMEALYQYLEKDEKIKSDGESAVGTLKIVQNIMELR